MLKWVHIALIAAVALSLALLLLLILRRCFKTRRQYAAERSQSLQNGIARLHQVSPHHHHLDHAAKKPSYTHLFRRGAPAFCWADHPSLVTDAVENGWSRFAFTTLMSSSPSVRSAMAMLGVCSSGGGDESNVEIGWEVCEGSADFLQKIRLNPSMKKVAMAMAMPSSMAAVSVMRTTLPLPGPNLGNSSFPQEAYFEITILSGNENVMDQMEVEKKGKSEGDKIKLIGEDFNAKNSPESVVSSHSQRKKKVEEVRNGGVWLCVGLTGGAPLPLRIPGTYPASIGFTSNGSLYLDGTKLVFESNDVEWGGTGKVIGCGYNPSQRKVFFTVDSQIVHEIHCKTEDFASPLYPTLAANTNVMVLVNLGQSPFKYGPANLQRTPNPCFVGPQATSPALGYDDSRELFSMGRIDSQWLQRSATRSNNNTVNSLKALEYDQESEGDLFEIVLDSSGRSPYTTLQSS